MKNLRIMSIVIFVLSTLAFGIFRIHEYRSMDSTAPVITFDQERIEYTVQEAKDKLLDGVTVTDDKTKNVMDTLVVERISEINEDNERIVTYAAIDEAGNVGRAERILKYTDYVAPWFYLIEPLRYKMGEEIDLPERLKAHSFMDGDLTGRIKYSYSNPSDNQTTGIRELSARVMDSAGRIVEIKFPLEIYDPSDERIKVNVVEPFVYVGVNTEFDPMAYYGGTESETGVLSIETNLDMSTPGMYYVDYIVTQGENNTGRNRLLVSVN